MRRGEARRSLDLLLGSVRMSKGEVGGHGIREQKTLLVHDADLPSIAVQLDVAEVAPIYQDPPTLRIVEPRDQAEQ